jgi:hypothetical protein
MSVRRRAWLAVTLAGVACLAALTVATHAHAQAAEPPALRVDTGDGRATTWTLAQLQALPPETSRAVMRDGGSFEARGVSVGSLLKLAGLDLNAKLGSAPVVGRALIARAADGYVAVFGLAEVDPHTSGTRRSWWCGLLTTARHSGAARASWPCGRWRVTARSMGSPTDRTRSARPALSGTSELPPHRWQLAATAWLPSPREAAT